MGSPLNRIEGEKQMRMLSYGLVEQSPEPTTDFNLTIDKRKLAESQVHIHIPSEL